MGTHRATAGSGKRVAIIDGLRTPFVKSGTVFSNQTTLQLAEAVVTELCQRTNIDMLEIDQLVYGQVVPSLDGPNIAREIVLGTGLPQTVDAYSVIRACATSTQALVNASQAIMTGDADVVICGGADSTSKPPIAVSDGLTEALVKANNAKTAMGKARAFLDLKPRDLLPKPPALRELSTGLTMGEAGEKMAKENNISRADQDAFALRSHQRAAAAWEKGVYAKEVMPFPIPPKYQQTVDKDGLVRPDTTLEKLGTLRPVFDKKHGSLTAGNSSPLTDGASALLVMSEKKAKALGYTPLAYVESWAFAGIDAAWQLLMGPVFAAPIALDQAKLKLDDVDLIDMHEAFAAQILSNIDAWGSAEFCKERLGRNRAVGHIDYDDERLNIYGGSISIGHPFAATGARQVLTMARELERRGGGTALITQCAAGGLGAALVIKR